MRHLLLSGLMSNGLGEGGAAVTELRKVAGEDNLVSSLTVYKLGHGNPFFYFVLDVIVLDTNECFYQYIQHAF